MIPQQNNAHLSSQMITWEIIIYYIHILPFFKELKATYMALYPLILIYT